MNPLKKLYKLLLLCCLYAVIAPQKCEYADIHVTNEHGDPQVFTVKQVIPANGVCNQAEPATPAAGGGGTVSPSRCSCVESHHQNPQHASADTWRFPTVGSGGDHNKLGSTTGDGFMTSSYKIATMGFRLPTVDPGWQYFDFLPTLALYRDRLVGACLEEVERLPEELCDILLVEKVCKNGVCHRQEVENKFTSSQLEHFAEEVQQEDLVPIPSSEPRINRKIAYAYILCSLEKYDLAIEHLTAHIEDNKNEAGMYYARAMVYARSSKQSEILRKALRDLSKAIELAPDHASGYELRAQVLLSQQRYKDAHQDAMRAVELNPTAWHFLVRGLTSFATSHLLLAEIDFREAAVVLEGNVGERYLFLNAAYNLGLTLYYRGKLRNAIEVFKDLLKDNTFNIKQAHICLAHSYRMLGDESRANTHFQRAIEMTNSAPFVQLLYGSMLFSSGHLSAAVDQFQNCVEGSPTDTRCRYMLGLTYMAQGQYYKGVKHHTKLIVRGSTMGDTIKMSPEFLKAQYVKEYARYLHHHLDSPVHKINPDTDLSEDLRHHWAILSPLPYPESLSVEQPGIQPHTSDVEVITEDRLSWQAKEILCLAEKAGDVAQVSVDGILPNKRLKMATGMAAVHVAQFLEITMKNMKRPNITQPHWQDIYDIAVSYRRLVDLQTPVFWLDSMPDHYLQHGYTSDLILSRGHWIDPRYHSYTTLVLTLVQALANTYDSDVGGLIGSKKFQSLLQKAADFQDLIRLALTNDIDDVGVMSTQVPGTRESSTRHEGMLLTLAGIGSGQLLLSINVTTSRDRTRTYYREMDFLFNNLLSEFHKSSLGGNMQVDAIMNIALSMAYYFYNLMPLTRGSSAVAYAVTLGIMMAVGYEISGNIPHGKLLEFEAMLSGGPDTFAHVVKQWLKPQLMENPISTVPSIVDHFPDLRSVVQALAIEHLSC